MKKLNLLDLSQVEMKFINGGCSCGGGLWSRFKRYIKRCADAYSSTSWAQDSYEINKGTQGY